MAVINERNADDWSFTNVVVSFCISIYLCTSLNARRIAYDIIFRLFLPNLNRRC